MLNFNTVFTTSCFCALLWGLLMVSDRAASVEDAMAICQLNNSFETCHHTLYN